MERPGLDRPKPPSGGFFFLKAPTSPGKRPLFKICRMSALGQKRTFAAHSRHTAFLNMTQTTMPITMIAAAKTIRKTLVSSAMEHPFFPYHHNAPVPPDL
jgi:hypothetical protein